MQPGSPDLKHVDETYDRTPTPQVVVAEIRIGSLSALGVSATMGRCSVSALQVPAAGV